MVGRRLENLALMLPLFGGLVILPPIIGIFSTEISLFGVPLIVIYLFSVWIALIVMTALLSPKMRSGAPSEHSAEAARSGAGEKP